ncbi:MAG: hypothetical protein HY744_04345 [Deltaproteobacteria bacterium]|nr:hypothetical protein [Deltaproteobacteria bacterium]
MELRPDAVIAGRLRLLAPLGQGGMGVVWSAHHLSLDTAIRSCSICASSASENSTDVSGHCGFGIASHLPA